MEENKNRFTFTYSAASQSDRSEAEEIRTRYEGVREHDAMEKLRALDKKTRRAPIAIGITVATIGAVLLALGFTLILYWELIPAGICLSLMGFFVIVCSYIVFRMLLRRAKQKNADGIIKLSDDVLNKHKTVGDDDNGGSPEENEQ